MWNTASFRGLHVTTVITLKEVINQFITVTGLDKLEAIEACNWLRAAGFPQYSQMYEDGHFSIDISSVGEDHKFLDSDLIQALIRRLNILNKCARMKVENVRRKSIQSPEESDEEQCALSENWKFQRTNRRWSRISSPLEVNNKHVKSSTPTGKCLSVCNHLTDSHNSMVLDGHQNSFDSYEEQFTNNFLCVPIDTDNFISTSGGLTSCDYEKSSDFPENGFDSLRRSGSERFKDGAKALLRRIESLKGKRKKKNREAFVNGDNLISNDSSPSIEAHGSLPNSLTSSPQLSCNKNPQDITSDQNFLCEGGSQEGQHRMKWDQIEETNLHASSDLSTSKFCSHRKDTNVKNEHSSAESGQCENLFMQEVSGDKEERQTKQINCTLPPTIIVSQTTSVEQSTNRLNRIVTAPVLTQTNDEQKCQQSSGIFYTSLIPNEVVRSQDESEVTTLNQTERQDSGVGSSLTRCNSALQTEWHWFPSVRRHSSFGIQTATSHGSHIDSLSASQLMKLRKLALLKLTSLMEKCNPTSRTGWNWSVPKFIRKIRSPDYNDRVVFGVPLVLVLQRTGQPLPPSIQVAIRYLRKTALHATGLFRKSGVRSRIQKLRNLNESNPGSICYENQQAYDVADLLKQYFRELPDALLTNKLSETFISIFQYIPVEHRKEATQAVVLLMPDVNREVLQYLLTFLQEVSQYSDKNQMTSTNLAVCFAPSLFHLSTLRSASVSPRRRKNVGTPDQRELNENRAAQECLNYMINNYRQLFHVTDELLRRANAEHWEPPTLEELGTLTNSANYNWKTHVEMYLQGLQKEAHDKFKGWTVFPHDDGVEVFYKKVDDGHPLRLWKVSVDVEAPPVEVLNRIMRERNVWDHSLVKWRVVSRLDNQTEIFQYVCDSLGSHPLRDYCVLRSWRTDFPKGSCILVEMSIDHPNAPPLQGSVRSVVLASHFMIEPGGAGKSRVNHVSRIDTRGRSPDWYNKVFGYMCALQLSCLRDSFRHGTEGPETKL
ncbi:stAR-related lipid transfer protein 13-like isoform X2 [Tachypleus tridentatus]|uniref:stAR-related lipid transfer protein 13-like isoform X2 n=1 Tax=Tachypleus tridentatus TaxID=6853 RepID=UPI003FD39B89